MEIKIQDRKKFVLCEGQKYFAMLPLVPFVKCFIGFLSLSVVYCVLAKGMETDFSACMLFDLAYICKYKFYFRLSFSTKTIAQITKDCLM